MRAQYRRLRWTAASIGVVLATAAAALAVPTPSSAEEARAGANPTRSAPTGVVVDGRARFQVITPSLIRLEFAGEQGRFTRTSFSQTRAAGLTTLAITAG